MRSAPTRRGPVEFRSLEAPEFEIVHQRYPIPWHAFIADVALGIIQTEIEVVDLGFEYGQTAAAVLQTLFWPVFGQPAEGERGERGRRPSLGMQIAAPELRSTFGELNRHRRYATDVS
jgi:hypothetical protein